MWTHNAAALPLPLSRPATGSAPDPAATTPALFVWTLPGSPSEDLIPALSHNDSHVLMPDRYSRVSRPDGLDPFRPVPQHDPAPGSRSEEHTSELQSLMRISYAVFCLKKKNTHQKH